MASTTRRRAVAVALLLVGWLALATAAADGLALVDRLATDERGELSRVVDEIERAPATLPDLDEALFAAARACEDVLADPARALALYDRLVRDFPSARRAAAAQTRATALRAMVGRDRSHAHEAAELAALIAEADRRPAADVEARAMQLASSAWPGAPEAALWLAEWLRRTGRLADAQARYAEVATRWPDTPHAVAAIRGGAGCAIDAGEWDLAERLAQQLPIVEPIDAVMRDELFERAARGRRFAWWYAVSWIALATIATGLVASLLEAVLRDRRRVIRDDGRGRRVVGALRPPVEVVFQLPVAAVLVGVAMTTHELIAPAVFWLCMGSVAMTWTSGIALETLRAKGRAVRVRALAHAVGCVTGVVALLYVLLVRDDLLEMIIETVRFGPSS